MIHFLKYISRYEVKLIFMVIMLSFVRKDMQGQIPPNAVNADPAVVSITQDPAGPNIFGTAVLQFRFANLGVAPNGQIPIGSIRLTISFPAEFAFTSVDQAPGFDVESSDDQPFGAVELKNNLIINEGEVIDIRFNVRGTAMGTGTVSFNVDRETFPSITVANTLTTNDNTMANFTTMGVLPLKLSEFVVKGEECTVDLFWKTAYEMDIASFEIEESTDQGASFNKIATIPAAGNSSSERRYYYSCSRKGSMPHLYRLKIIENKGDNFSYGPIKRIGSGCINKQDLILLYPTPVKSVLNATISDASLMNTTATIIDMNGRPVLNFKVTNVTMSIDIGKLPAGTYVVRLASGRGKIFVKK